MLYQRFHLNQIQKPERKHMDYRGRIAGTIGRSGGKSGTAEKVEESMEGGQRMLEKMLTLTQAQLDLRANIGELSEAKRSAILGVLKDDFEEDVPTPAKEMIARRSAEMDLMIFVATEQLSIAKSGLAGKPFEHGLTWANRILEKCLIETVQAVSLNWTGQARGKQPASEACSAVLSERGKELLLSPQVQGIGYHMFLGLGDWTGDVRVEPLAKDKSLFFVGLALNRGKPGPTATATEGLQAARETIEGRIEAILVGMGVG